MSKLKECPFCGGESELKHRASSSYWVECEFCAVRGHDSFFKSVALAKWNNRSSIPNTKIQKLIDCYKYNAEAMGVNDTAGNELSGVAYDLEKLIGVSR